MGTESMGCGFFIKIILIEKYKNFTNECWTYK